MSVGDFAKQIKHAVKKPISLIAKDWALGHAFPRAYAKAVALSKVDPNKVVFLDVKTSEMPDAFSVIYPYMRTELGMDVEFIGLGQHSAGGWLAYYKRCIASMSKLAAAKYIFLCDACDVVSCIALRPETKVVQLWHACGAFKKWGVSTANLKFGGSRKGVERHPFYKNLSLVTVSSPEVEWAYREAMMLEDTPSIVQPLGVSRTDVFFDEEFLRKAKHIVEERVPQACNKKIALYAPTFRGHADEAEGPDALDFRAMNDALSDDWILLVKHHPYVKKPKDIPADCSEFAFMVSDIPTDILLSVADVCISDYSSIVFEYSLFERPMVFFAYDLDNYNDWRGFYYDYEEMTPGPVLKTTEELIDYIKGVSSSFDKETVKAFKERFMSSCDGKATARICNAVVQPSTDAFGR